VVAAKPAVNTRATAISRQRGQIQSATKRRNVPCARASNLSERSEGRGDLERLAKALRMGWWRFPARTYQVAGKETTR